MPIISDFLLLSAAKLFTLTLIWDVAMVVALLVARRFAKRRDTAGEPYDSIKTWYFYGFIALNILYMIVALVIGVPSAGVLVAHLLLMGLLTIVTFTIFHEKGTFGINPLVDASYTTLSVYGFTILSLFFCVAYTVSAGKYDTNLKPEVVNGQVVSARHTILPNSDGHYARITNPQNDTPTDRNGLTGITADHTWVERGDDGTITQVTTGNKLSENVVRYADDLTGGQEPYAEYAPMYAVDGATYTEGKLCVLNRDSGCALNARHVRTQVTIHIPHGSYGKSVTAPYGDTINIQQ